MKKPILITLLILFLSGCTSPDGEFTRDDANDVRLMVKGMEVDRAYSNIGYNTNYGLAMVALVALKPVIKEAINKKYYDTSGNLQNKIHIKAPLEIENPRIIPFFISVSPVKSGEVLNIFINNKLAYSVRPNGESYIEHFSGRLRGTDHNGQIKVEVASIDSVNRSQIYNFKVTSNSVAKIPNTSDGRISHRARWVNNKLRVAFDNDMGLLTRINDFVVNTPMGRIDVLLTPFVSGGGMGYFAIGGNFSRATVDEVNLTLGL